GLLVILIGRATKEYFVAAYRITHTCDVVGPHNAETLQMRGIGQPRNLTGKIIAQTPLRPLNEVFDRSIALSKKCGSNLLRPGLDFDRWRSQVVFIGFHQW